jgi:hypothetical protein
MNYSAWMKEVDKLLTRDYNLTQDELPDWLSHDAFKDGLSPEEGVEQLLEETGFLEYIEEYIDEQ